MADSIWFRVMDYRYATRDVYASAFFWRTAELTDLDATAALELSTDAAGPPFGGALGALLLLTLNSRW